MMHEAAAAQLDLETGNLSIGNAEIILLLPNYAAVTLSPHKIHHEKSTNTRYLHGFYVCIVHTTYTHEFA